MGNPPVISLPWLERHRVTQGEGESRDIDELRASLSCNLFNSLFSGAAIYGLRGKKDCSVFILHPRNRISPVQEAQMTSVLDDNGKRMKSDGEARQEIFKQLSRHFQSTILLWMAPRLMIAKKL